MKRYQDGGVIEASDGGYIKYDDAIKTLQTLLERIVTDSEQYVYLMSFAELRCAVAYHQWQDGMEWDDVMEIWEGTNPLYGNKTQCCDCLIHTFGRI
jgi:hypothetical protein